MGIFSFYQTFSGVRAIQFKKAENQAKMIDWFVDGLDIAGSGWGNVDC